MLLYRCADTGRVRPNVPRLAIGLTVLMMLCAGSIFAVTFARYQTLQRARAALIGQDRLTALALFQQLADDSLDHWDLGLGRRLARMLNWEPDDPVAEALYQQALLTNDSVEALALLRRAGERGHVDAQYKLGGIYLDGRGVRKDANEALRWLEQAASAGHAPAQNDVGRLLAAGDLGEPDFVEAATWFTLAAKQGYLEAHYNLAQLYLKGLGVEKSPEEALRWLLPVAEAGNADAAAQVGVIYMDGAEKAPERYAEAAAWFARAAEAGNAGALAALGGLYELGHGVDQDVPRSLEFYRRAALAGSIQGAFHLGLAYAHGRGVELDVGEGLVWLRKAAEQLPEARAELSKLEQSLAQSAQAMARQRQAEALTQELRSTLERYESIKRLNETVCGEGTVRQVGNTYLRLSKSEWDLCISNQQELEALSARISVLRAQLAGSPAARSAPEPTAKRECQCENGVTSGGRLGDAVACWAFCRTRGGVRP